MTTITRLGRYVGGGTALAGLAISAAFLGPRTADPIAASVVDPLTVWIRSLGLLLGLAVVAIGLRTIGLAGNRDESEDEREA